MEFKKNISDNLHEAWSKLVPTCAERIKPVLYHDYILKMEEATEEFELLCMELAGVTEELLAELSSLERELSI